jgi:hypothetical protein
MVVPKGGGPAKGIWAYAYELVPPQPQDRLSGVKAILDREHTDARLLERTWEGRFVAEQQVTHILVVSDGPEQSHDVNRRLESALRDLGANFTITTPLAVADAIRPAPQGSQE